MNVSTMERQSFKLVNPGNIDGGILLLPMVSLVLHMLTKPVLLTHKLNHCVNRGCICSLIEMYNPMNGRFIIYMC